MKKQNRKPKICLVSSSGGHFEQLQKLQPLIEKYDGFIVTEKTKYNTNEKKVKYFFPQVNRKEFLFIPKMIWIGIKSLLILLKECPNVIISTGVLASTPLLVWGHILGKKIIYIESFAKINSPTKTGKFVYKFADQFYVQWESMLEFYPKAIYKGGIY